MARFDEVNYILRLGVTQKGLEGIFLFASVVELGTLIWQKLLKIIFSDGLFDAALAYIFNINVKERDIFIVDQFLASNADKNLLYIILYFTLD